MTFGERLQELRAARRWSQKDLAKVVGCNHTYICKLENDATTFGASRDLICTLALALEADLWELLALAGKMPEELETMMLSSRGARVFWRRAAAASLTDPEWDWLSGQVETLCQGRTE